MMCFNFYFGTKRFESLMANYRRNNEDFHLLFLFFMISKVLSIMVKSKCKFPFKHCFKKRQLKINHNLMTVPYNMRHQRVPDHSFLIFALKQRLIINKNWPTFLNNYFYFLLLSSVKKICTYANFNFIWTACMVHPKTYLSKWVMMTHRKK